MLVRPAIRLVRRLGAGGMGSVWVADHLSLHTQVVVKFIAVELAAREEAVERFSREAAAAAQVKSPHVVQMFDHGVTQDGIAFIVMELLEGVDLGKHLAARKRLSIGETASVISQVCKALARAHERGIVHRDIKPDNIFLCSSPDGETFVKLLDFGIAKGNVTLSGSSGTKTGATIGTPFYMSPEQIVGAKNVDGRADLWSLGVVAYECLLGVRPFHGEVFGELAIRIHSGPIPVPSEVDPGLPRAFDQWFARACARDVANRFGSAKELGDSLALVASGMYSVPAVAEPPRIQAFAYGPVAAMAPPTVAGRGSGARTLSQAGVMTTPPARRRGVVAVSLVASVLGLVGAIGATLLVVRHGNSPDRQPVAPKSAATSAAMALTAASNAPPALAAHALPDGGVAALPGAVTDSPPTASAAPSVAFSAAPSAQSAAPFTAPSAQSASGTPSRMNSAAKPAPGHPAPTTPAKHDREIF
jgi:serine/threonine-protein kinase